MKSSWENGPLGGNGETPIEMIQKLRLCRFPVASFPKRFIRELNVQLVCGTLNSLSPKQLHALRRLRYMYRNQIGSADAVDQAWIDRWHQEHPESLRVYLPARSDI